MRPPQSNPWRVPSGGGVLLDTAPGLRSKPSLAGQWSRSPWPPVTD
jgi:hypothetical protein